MLVACFKIGSNGTYNLNIVMLGLLESSELLCTDMLFYAWVLKDKRTLEIAAVFEF